MPGNKKKTKEHLVEQSATAKHNSDKSEVIQYWIDYWPKLDDAKLDSEEHFDKKIFALSAGTIGIELSILQFVGGKPELMWCVLISALFCLISLTLNLIVQFVASSMQEKQSRMIRAFIEDPTDDDSFIYKRLIRDNKRLKCINIISMVSLVLGIVFLGVFTFINLI